MDKAERVAYIQAMGVCAQIEAMGMQALNQYRIDRGETIAYNEEAFMSLLDKYGIHHNAVISYLLGN